MNRYDRDGKKHGYWKTFYEDWTLHTECYYKHGLRDGFYKEYDEKGNLKKITKFVNDVEQLLESDQKPLVVQHEYYPNGKVKREASFRDGKREGVWREFDEKGNVINSQTYKKGALVGEGIVDTDGKRRGEYKEFYPDSTFFIPTALCVQKAFLLRVYAQANGSFITTMVSFKRLETTRKVNLTGFGYGIMTTAKNRLKNSSTKVSPMDRTRNMTQRGTSSFRALISMV